MFLSVSPSICSADIPRPCSLSHVPLGAQAAAAPCLVHAPAIGAGDGC